MPKRMYLVELKKRKVLIEASSQEAAVKTATAPMVKSVTIPTSLEVARLMRDGVETIAPSIAPLKTEPAKDEGLGKPADEGDGEGVGRMNLAEGEDD